LYNLAFPPTHAQKVRVLKLRIKQCVIEALCRHRGACWFVVTIQNSAKMLTLFTLYFTQVDKLADSQCETTKSYVTTTTRKRGTIRAPHCDRGTSLCLLTRRTRSSSPSSRRATMSRARQPSGSAAKVFSTSPFIYISRRPTGAVGEAHPSSPHRSPLHAGRPLLPGHCPFGCLRCSGLHH
jgi:hypothetical protein